MSLFDVAGDWKRVNADLLTRVTVREADAAAGPADDDARAEGLSALQWDERSGPVRTADGGEVSATTCRFEFAVADVGFAVRQYCRVTDGAGRVWKLESVKTDSSGELYAAEATLTRSDQ